MPDRANPVLPSRSLESTESFYAGFGFTTVFKDEGWLILRRGTVELEFYPRPDLKPERSDAMCTVRVADPEELIAAIRAARVPEREVGIPRVVPLREQEWGLRAGWLIDLDGAQLTLIEDPGTRTDAT